MKFSEKASVVSSLWHEFREDEDFSDFMAYNNVGCPLAYSFEQGLIAQLTPKGIEIVEETFNQFLEQVNVSVEEIDEILPDKNLGAILVFAHAKMKVAEEKESSGDGMPLNEASSVALDFDTENPNRGDNFSHYAHAYNALFGTKFSTLEEISNNAKQNGDILLDLAEGGNAEALLMLSVIYCTQNGNYLTAHTVAKRALEEAKKNNSKLGRFLFGYGFALEQIEDFDSAVDAYEEALDLGFGAAAFNFGRIMMAQNLDLSSAIRVWKIGRDQYKDYVCKEMIEDLETSPGVYQATIPGPDGTSEMLIASDNPGGLGTFR